MEFTDKDIKKLHKISDDELYNYAISLNYSDWQDLYSSVYKIWWDLHCKNMEYKNIEESAAKMKARLIYQKDIAKERNNIKKEYNKWNRLYNIIFGANVDKKKTCKHEYRLVGCCGYDRENEIYHCAKCGNEIIK